MRHSYIIYPDTISKIESAPFFHKIQKYKEKHFWYPVPSGYQSTQDIGDLLDNLHTKFPKESHDIVMKVSEILESESLENSKWRVCKGNPLQLPLFQTSELPENEETNTYTGEYDISCATSDIILATWYWIWELLSKREIKEYKSYGFDTLLDFIMSIEAYLQSKENQHVLKNDEYSFTREWVKTVITWDVHWDFRLFQTDEGANLTYSPFGNKIGLKPQEINVIGWYHSVEVVFLSVILKYISQIGSDKEIESTLRDVFEYSNQIGNRFGNFWEFWWDNFWDRTGLHLTFLRNIEEIDSQKRSFIWIPNQLWDLYRAYVNKENELLFVWFDNSIMARFSKDDVGNLLRWIIYQCAHGHGRTSKKRIMDIIQYRFSKEFIKKMSELQ